MKKYTLPVISTRALWQLMYLGTWCTIHHVSKCMTYRKAFVVITGRAFYIYIYIYIYIKNICIKYIMCIYKYKYILYIYYVITNKQMNSTHYYLAILILMLLHNLQAIQMLCYTPQAQTLWFLQVWCWWHT